MFFSYLMGAALTASSPSPGLPTAPPAVVAPAEQPSEAEARALAEAYSPSAMRRDVELGILRTQFVYNLEKNPESAAMLKAFPALGPALVEAIAGNIDIYMAEYDERFFPRATIIIRENLGRADTLAMTRFYRSETGRRILQTASKHVDATEVAQAGLEHRAVDPSVIVRQNTATAGSSLAALSLEDRQALATQMMSPAGQHFARVAPRFASLQAELISNPGPCFQEKTQQAISAAFTRVTGLTMPAAK